MLILSKTNLLDLTKTPLHSGDGNCNFEHSIECSKSFLMLVPKGKLME